MEIHQSYLVSLSHASKVGEHGPISFRHGQRPNSSIGTSFMCHLLEELSLWIRCSCHHCGTLLRFGLARRKSYVRSRLCFVTTCDMVLRTMQEHKWVGMTTQCRRKVEVWVLFLQRMLYEHLWVNSLFKLSSANQTCKFCRGTASCNYNLLAMGHGDNPCYGLSPQISLSKVGWTCGTILCERWWQEWLVFFLHHAWNIFCNWTYDGRFEYQGLYFGITMDRAFVLHMKCLQTICDLGSK